MYQIAFSIWPVTLTRNFQASCLHQLPRVKLEDKLRQSIVHPLRQTPPPGSMPSKSSKKAWRRRSDVTEDVEEGLQGVTMRERHGKDLSAAHDSSLFFEDKGGAVEPPAASCEAQRSKQRKILKSEAILSAGHAVKPVVSQHSRKPKQETAAKTGKQLASPAQQQHRQPKVNAVEALTDLWDADDAQQPASKRRRPATLGTIGQPAVAVDLPGCSYNPDVEQHQDAVAAAVAAEVQKAIQQDLQPEAPPARVDGDSEQDDLAMLQVEEQPDWGPPADESGAAPGEGVDRRPAVPKSRTQRNKELRRRAADAELQERAQQKAARQALSHLKDLVAELDAEHQHHQAKALRKQISLAEKRAALPPRLGKAQFKAEPVQVLLSEELRGSLRGLKASSMLARDRFKSLQQRGIIEPRTQAQNSGGKRKELERFGNRDRPAV